MSDIIKNCKIHGNLTKDEIYITKNKRKEDGFYIVHNCKFCRKLSMVIYQLKRKSLIRICRISDCKRKINNPKTSLCATHLSRWQKYKSYNLPIKPSLPEGIVRICEIHGELDELKVKKTYIKRKKSDRYLPYPYMDSECKYCYSNRVKKSRIKKQFGLSIEEYEELFIGQNGKCGICNKEETSTKWKTSETRKLAVDHCHETKIVRGLLCSRCNTALGSFKDSLENLESAIKWLLRQNK